MILPILLLLLSTGAAALLALGTHPDLAYHAHGLACIMLTRRLEWPLVLLALLPCVGVLLLVISGKKRVWC